MSIFYRLAAKLALTVLAAFSSHASTDKAQESRTPIPAKKIVGMQTSCWTKKNLGDCMQLRDLARINQKNTELEKTLIVLCESTTSPEACFELGSAANKKSVTMDAIHWLRLACKQRFDNGRACLQLAEIAAQQKSKKDEKHWKEIACSQGAKEGCVPPNN